MLSEFPIFCFINNYFKLPREKTKLQYVQWFFFDDKICLWYTYVPLSLKGLIKKNFYVFFLSSSLKGT